MKTSGIDREGSKFERMKKDAAHIRQMLKNRITPADSTFVSTKMK